MDGQVVDADFGATRSRQSLSVITGDIGTLIVTDQPERRLAIFNTEDGSGVDPLLAFIKARIDAWNAQPHSIETKTGRDEIRAFAHKITKTKTVLKGVGKAVADEVKKVPKNVDGSRRKLIETIEAWHDEVRKPLTEWEAEDEKRKDKHRTAVAAIEDMAAAGNLTAPQIRERIASAQALQFGPETEDFLPNYASAKARVLKALEEALLKRVADDAKDEELATLRAEAAARKREDEARAAAASPVPETAPRAAETAPALSPAPLTPLERKIQVNRAALAALVEAGIPEDLGKVVITLIAQGSVPAVSIDYGAP